MTKLRDLLDMYDAFYQQPDHVVIEATMATYLSNYMPRPNPIWEFIVGPPSAMKTDLCFAFKTCTDAVYRTEFTPAAFMSGKAKETKDDLLSVLDGKVLLVKDFTSVLTFDDRRRDQLFSKLRQLYDGEIDAQTALAGYKHWAGCFTLVTAVTEIIDAYTHVQQTLGERFIKVRMRPGDGDDERKRRRDVAERAYENLGADEARMEHLQEETRTFVKAYASAITKRAKYDLPRPVVRALGEIADFSTVVRTAIPRDRYNNPVIFPSAEEPARFMKVLSKLLVCLTAIRGKREAGEDELRVIARVALDCLPEMRLRTMRGLVQTDWTTAGPLSLLTGIPKPTLLYIILSDFQMLKVCDVAIEGNPGTKFRFGDAFRSTYEKMIGRETWL